MNRSTQFLSSPDMDNISPFSKNPEYDKFEIDQLSELQDTYAMFRNQKGGYDN